MQTTKESSALMYVVIGPPRIDRREGEDQAGPLCRLLPLFRTSVRRPPAAAPALIFVQRETGRQKSFLVPFLVRVITDSSA